MYSTFIILQGLVITIMVWFNASLSESVGSRLALLCIHLAGLTAIVAVRLFRKARWEMPRVKPYLLSAGLIGVCVVFLQNAAFNQIGASLTITATLIGQIVISFLVDTFGFFDTPVRKPTLKRISPMLFVAAGFFLLMWGN